MPSRYITSDLLTDGNVRHLTPEAFSFWLLLLVSADDFGIVRATPSDMAALLATLRQEFPVGSTPRQEIPVIYRNFQQLVELGFIKICEFNSRYYVIFKPDSFDRVQYQLVNKRTNSKSLGLPKSEAIRVRLELWNESLQEIPVGYTRLLEIPASRARKHKQSHSESIINNNISECVSGNNSQPPAEVKPKPGRPRQPKPPADPVSNGHHPAPASSPPANTVTAQVIAILHDIGTTTGVVEYTKITAAKWAAQLEREGQRIGFRCLLARANGFRTHMLHEHDKGRLDPRATHNPRARFFTNWTEKTFPDRFTTGDSDELPSTPPVTTPVEIKPLDV